MATERREPQPGRARVVRKGNVVGGVVLLLGALVVASAVSSGGYPWFSDALGIVMAIAALVLAIRAFQPSVSISDEEVKARRWIRTVRLPRSSVKAVQVLKTSDGPRTVRKIALVDLDNHVYRTHFQSPEPMRKGVSTAADRAAAAIRSELRLPEPHSQE